MVEIYVLEQKIVKVENASGWTIYIENEIVRIN